MGLYVPKLLGRA